MSSTELTELIVQPGTDLIVGKGDEQWKSRIGREQTFSATAASPLTPYQTGAHAGGGRHLAAMETFNHPLPFNHPFPKDTPEHDEFNRGWDEAVKFLMERDDEQP